MMRIRQSTTTRWMTVFAATTALGTALAAASAASGQHALGGGNALDANLNAQTGPTNVPLSPVDFGLRNRIVTRNVAGGRGFRGTVGYGAEGDFRGQLGSDDIFDFRAGSALSSLDFITGAGPAASVRYGAQLGLIEYDRAAQGATLREVLRGDTVVPLRDRYQTRFDQQLRIDREALARSLAGQFEIPETPAYIGEARDRRGRYLTITASGIQGLRVSPIQESYLRANLTPYDLARLRADMQGTQDAPFQGMQPGVQPGIEPGMAPGAPSPEQPLTDTPDERPGVVTGQRESAILDTPAPEGPADARINARSPSDYEAILARVAQRYARQANANVQIDPSLYNELGDEYRALREALRGREDARRGQRQPPELTQLPEFQPGAEPGAEPEDDEADPMTPTVPGITPSTGPFGDGAEDEDRPGWRRRERRDQPADISDLGRALDHGLTIGELSQETRDWVNSLIRAGEEALREGRYFDAEQRFSRALRLASGHPLAAAGLAHAQLGAGLHLSAALTLRDLFVNRPEMIDVRFESTVRPGRTRLLSAADLIDARLDHGEDRAAMGLVLAYIGHQLDERAFIERGLEAMADADAANDAADDPLLPLLEELWLQEPSDAQPAPEAGASENTQPAGDGEAGPDDADAPVEPGK